MENIKAPKGTHDIFYPEVKKWQFLEQKVREFFESLFYREIRTPIFERTELFNRGIGDSTDVVQKEMYTFEDKAGRSITLRPENTASVVRALIENNLFNIDYPLRYYYYGPMFRYDKPQKGRYRQFHQFGVEVFGSNSPELDAEVIYSASRFLKEIGIDDIKVEVNSVGCNKCRPNYIEELKKVANDNKDNLCQDCQRKIDTNPLRIFDCKNRKCIETSNKFPMISDYLCDECSVHFNETLNTLKYLDVEFIVNKRLVRGLDYYTKTAFEITSSKLGAQNAILGGGRYSNLVKEIGGPDIEGIGFAAGIERILLHIDDLELKKKPSVFIAYQSKELLPYSLEIFKLLIENNRKVYMEYGVKNFKKQLKKASKLEVDYTFVIGEDEVNKGFVTIKDMKEFKQIKINKSELMEWLKENL